MHRNINIIYHNTFPTRGALKLNEDKWHSLIDNIFNNLKASFIGSLLLKELHYFLDTGCQLIIKSDDLDYRGMITYPKTRFEDNKAIIIFPCISYFVKVPVIEQKDIDALNDENNKSILLEDYKTISNYGEIKKPLITSDIEKLKSTNTIKYDPETYFVIFVHELIHVLRHYNGINLEGDCEEVATITGLTGNSLYIHGNLITENTIRKELGKPPRVYHESINVYVDDVVSTHTNSHMFSEESFFTI